MDRTYGYYQHCRAVVEVIADNHCYRAGSAVLQRMPRVKSGQPKTASRPKSGAMRHERLRCRGEGGGVVWAQIEEWECAYESEEKENRRVEWDPVRSTPCSRRDLSDSVKIIYRSCQCSQYMSLAGSSVEQSVETGRS